MKCNRCGWPRNPGSIHHSAVAGPPTKAWRKIEGLSEMPNDGAGSTKGNWRDDAAPTSGDAGKTSSKSRKPRRRPVSERIIEEISVERRVALEILADR